MYMKQLSQNHNQYENSGKYHCPKQIFEDLFYHRVYA